MEMAGVSRMMSMVFEGTWHGDASAGERLFLGVWGSLGELWHGDACAGERLFLGVRGSLGELWHGDACAGERLL